MHLSLPKWFPLFILASSVCWSLQCLISTLTQGNDGGLFFRLTCSIVVSRGRNTANKYHWRICGVLAVFQPHWFCSCSGLVCFHGLPFPGSVLLCRELSDAVPGLHALPRSISHSGSGSRVLHKGADLVGPAFVPVPSLSSSGDQVLG